MAKYKVIKDFKNEQVAVLSGDIIDGEPMKGEKMVMVTVKDKKVLLPKEIVEIHQEIDNPVLNKKKPVILKVLPFIGVAGGATYCYVKKLSPFAYIGWSILGGVLLAIPLFVWADGAEKMSMVGKPSNRENAIKKLYLLLKEIQNQKNKSEGINDQMVSEAEFKAEVEKQKISDDELVFLYQFNKGMFDMMQVPKDKINDFYHNLSKQLSLIYDGALINSAQVKFNKLNIIKTN